MNDLALSLGSWAVVTDVRVWFVIALLAAAMLGRTGLYRSPWIKVLTPWNRRRRDPSRASDASASASASAPRRHPLRDPWFLAMVVIASAAVVSWIVMTAIASNRALR